MFETADSVSCRWENVISFCCKVLLRIVNICNRGNVKCVEPAVLFPPTSPGSSVYRTYCLKCGLPPRYDEHSLPAKLNGE